MFAEEPNRAGESRGELLLDEESGRHEHGLASDACGSEPSVANKPLSTRSRQVELPRAVREHQRRHCSNESKTRPRSISRLALLDRAANPQELQLHPAQHEQPPNRANDRPALVRRPHHSRRDEEESAPGEEGNEYAVLRE